MKVLLGLTIGELNMWSEGIWEGMVTFFIVCIVLAVAVGAGLMWALPKAWEWLKPIVHAVTA